MFQPWLVNEHLFVTEKTPHHAHHVGVALRAVLTHVLLLAFFSAI